MIWKILQSSVNEVTIIKGHQWYVGVGGEGTRWSRVLSVDIS